VIVVDTSIALQWVLSEPEAVRTEVYLGNPEVIAPDVLLVEVANVLAKKVRAGDLAVAESLEAPAIVRGGVARLIPTVSVVSRALEISVKISHPVYDCVFLACAEQVKGQLATRDAPFIKRVTERGLGHLLESVP
jgi:predicted nucleic acid-binding protein